MINLVNNCVLVVGCNHNAVDYGNLVDPVVNRTHIFAFLPSRFFFSNNAGEQRVMLSTFYQ